MKPLIDCDVLRYEIGACGQHKDEEGELIIRDFSFVAELFDAKVKEICDLVWADEEPLLFLTVCTRTKHLMNRPILKRISKLEKELTGPASPEMNVLAKELTALKDKLIFRPNFREELSKEKVYKGTRVSEKPFHYENLTAYIQSTYNCIWAQGIEADDALAMYQLKANAEGKKTIICTRDKDLRMVPGMHFGWACGKQSAFGPELVDEIGAIHLTYDDKDKLKGLKGTGLSFFCAQMIMGDQVDNIQGIPGKGPRAAFDTLTGLTTQVDLYKAVRDAYRAKYGDDWAHYMLEQAQLLWMVRELNEDGSPKMWELPEYLYESD